ncbi:transketolase [Clostridium sp. chh4-2]|uniref:transketolase n=1 Tax=Clostridium sp. chh4-2 TaxID=2067550 RepID=UPI000CCDB88A|nr:transketolase [Clostridium sp. chh4-2]PNV61194.1 transketolase [Clostridium sp. chh4-2]
MEQELKIQLQKFASKLRMTEMDMFGNLGFGHIGGTLSATDLIAVLYGAVMRYDPENPKWEERDRFVSSKGHAGPGVYSALALNGFFPKEWLNTLNQGGTNLPSHCDRKKTPGIDMTTGSLGQGASLALGMAMALRDKESYVYLLMGDGECNEGQVWEMALSAAHHKVNHLIAFVDYNHKQLDGNTEDILNMGDIRAKFEAFGWYAQEIDGNDVEQIYDGIERAKKQAGSRPSVMVMQTVKGKGVKWIEEMRLNHHITITREQADSAIRELGAQEVRECLK